LYYIYRPPTHKNTNKTHPRTQQSGIYPANPPCPTSQRRARVEQEGHLGGGWGTPFFGIPVWRWSV